MILPLDRRGQPSENTERPRGAQQAHVPERDQEGGLLHGGHGHGHGYGRGAALGRRGRLTGRGIRVSTQVQEQPAAPLPERLAAPRHGGQRRHGRPQEEPLRLLQLQRVRRRAPLAVLLRG